MEWASSIACGNVGTLPVLHSAFVLNSLLNTRVVIILYFIGVVKFTSMIWAKTWERGVRENWGPRLSEISVRYPSI